MKKRWQSAGLFLSVLLHFGIVGAVVYFGLRQPPVRLPTPFELVALPGETRPDPAPAAESEPLIRFQEPVAEPSPPTPAPEPIVLPELPPRPAPTPPPEPRPEPPREQVRWEDFRRENPVRPPRPRPPAETRPVEVPRIDIDRINRNLQEIVANSAEARRVAQMSQADRNELESYFVRVQRAIREAWNRPTRLPTSLSATVEFTVTPQGLITQARIVQSSGNADFDNSVLRAFAAARSPGPPPDGRGYPLRVTFRMDDAS